MTKEEERKLLVTDLSGRLPYDTYLWSPSAENNRTVLTPVVLDNLINTNLTLPHLPQVKPYLRSISDMTKEECDRLFEILKINKYGYSEDWIKINDVLGIKFIFPTGKWIEDVIGVFDYLNSIHVDYRGLIDQGLAIRVTEEFNPYK